MDHLRFQSNQTAAAYVANALDDPAREAFELHLMSCMECVSEVEGWRAIKQHLPHETRGRSPQDVAKPAQRASDAPHRRPAGIRWRVAGSLVGVALAGVAGGWFLGSSQAPWRDSNSMAFYSLPGVMRGPSDCTAMHLEFGTRLVAVRIPGAAPDQQLIAIDSSGRDLAADNYTSRPQGDGSWLVRMRADTVRGQRVRFEARGLDGTVEPRGCVQSWPAGH